MLSFFLMLKSFLRWLIMVRPVRLAVWLFVERINVKGRKLLTLRQHRKLSHGINRLLIDEDKGKADDSISEHEKDHLNNFGWCKISSTNSETIDKATEFCLKVAKQKIGVVGKKPNPYVLASKEELLKEGSVVQLINQKGLFNLASSYLGGQPYIRDVDILFSDVQPALEGAQLFHLDNINYRALRLIFILEDVSEVNGPFTFYDLEQSKSINRVLKYQDRRDYNIISDEEVNRAVDGIEPHKLTGKKGELFFADTCGCLHCGSRVLSGHRLVLMATFTSLLPTNLRWLRSGEKTKMLKLPLFEG